MILIYKMEGCPYCNKVLKHLEEKNIEYKALDISENANHDALMHWGGKEQVPFLVDTDKNIHMYESSDIIEYIDTL